MTLSKAQCLILACGNTLRGDDGVGPWLCSWAEERFAAEEQVRMITRQQWTPDLAEDIATAAYVLFVDCSVESAPGEIKIQQVNAAKQGAGLATHHTGAQELLQLAKELYGSLPQRAQMLTVGAGALEVGESFSSAVREAMPHACCVLEQTVREFLEEPN